MDLKALVVLAAAGLGVGLAAAIALAWSSPASKTLAISAATLLGAAVLFTLQLVFELRPTEDVDFLSVELTIDRGKPLIRQWRYSPENVSARLEYEHQVSGWLATNRPAAFDNRSHPHQC